MKDEIGESNIKNIFNPDDKHISDKKIGTNQFVELANLCSNKDIQCYDEIELLVKYNTAKAYNKEKGQSWAYVCKNSQKFGDIVVTQMNKIKNANPNDESTLKDLSLFFGYLFWQSKVWIMETSETSNIKK